MYSFKGTIIQFCTFFIPKNVTKSGSKQNIRRKSGRSRIIRGGGIGAPTNCNFQCTVKRNCSGFPRRDTTPGGGGTLTYYLASFHRKLHENEEILAERSVGIEPEGESAVDSIPCRDETQRGNPPWLQYPEHQKCKIGVQSMLKNKFYSLNESTTSDTNISNGQLA